MSLICNPGHVAGSQTLAGRQQPVSLRHSDHYVAHPHLGDHLLRGRRGVLFQFGHFTFEERGSRFGLRREGLVQALVERIRQHAIEDQAEEQE